jgi:hypothetical protein
MIEVPTHLSVLDILQKTVSQRSIGRWVQEVLGAVVSCEAGLHKLRRHRCKPGALNSPRPSDALLFELARCPAVKQKRLQAIGDLEKVNF